MARFRSPSVSERRETPARRLVRGALLVLLAAGAGACDLFSTRTPEPPGAPEAIIILSAPDSVYAQLLVGIEQRSIVAVMNVFDSSGFTFNPDPEDSTAVVTQLNPNAFDDWDYAVEEQVQTFILGNPEPLALTLGVADSTAIGDDLVEIRKEYFLTADGRQFEGRADWTLERVGGEWRITRWADNRLQGAELPSWTLLKGENR